MARKAIVTPAIRVLRTAGVDYTAHHYEYTPHSGASGGAEQLAVDVHSVIKTLILETTEGRPICVLMHGDREVSLKALARHLNVKGVTMADPDTARRYSGYQVGGTSPFGLRTAMSTLCETTIADQGSVFVNGGKRGFLIELAVADLVAVLNPEFVEVAIMPETR
ncbi:Cys-tRNA(Pro) deacylase [Actinomycetota bacterium]